MSTPKPVKVKVSIDALHVDGAAWTLNYGVEGATAIREDVKAYVTSLVREHLLDLGVLVTETAV